MYELVQAASRSFYIQSPARIGVVLGKGNEVSLIDSGSDKDAGRKVKKLLDARGWKLKAMFNTTLMPTISAETAASRARPDAASMPAA